MVEDQNVCLTTAHHGRDKQKRKTTMTLHVPLSANVEEDSFIKSQLKKSKLASSRPIKIVYSQFY